MKEKLHNLNLIRIIGCLAIVMFHLLYDSSFEITKNGNKAVDLFFILSGFFFIYTFNRNMTLFDFIKHKIIRFYPVLLFGVTTISILSLFEIVSVKFYDQLILLLSLSGTPLSLGANNMYFGQYWYCSILLWVLVLLFYLLKNYEKKNVNLFIVLAVIFSYSFILESLHGEIKGCDTTFYYIFHIGTIRGIGGIGLGYLIGNWYINNYKKFADSKIKLLPKLLISIAEFVCLYFVITNLGLHNIQCNNHFIFIIVYTILITLFLYKKGFISQWLNNKIFSNFSKYTYSIFITHLPLIYILRQMCYDKGYMYTNASLCFIILTGIILLTGIITYHLIESPATKYLNKKFPVKTNDE